MVEMCSELACLKITLKLQELGLTQTLQDVVLEKVKDLNFDFQHLTLWAIDLLKEFGMWKDS